MTRLLRSLIRETLLLEEVYGAQAVVYHGTKADPIALIDALLKDKFKAGEGDGAMYGKGLYTVYDPDGARTMTGFYGDHVIKLKVNLYGYIIFDPEIALKVYKRPLTPAEQAEEVGYSDTVIEVLGRVGPSRSDRFTSDSALSVYKSLQYEVKGLVFTGENDGRVAVVYDPTTAVPMAWKRVTRNGKPVSRPWTPVDRAALLAPLERPDVRDREGRPVQQSALGRSALGDFEAGKWDPLTLLKRVEILPKDQRVVKGDLDLTDAPITSLPMGLKVGGNLELAGTPITSLPVDLKVGGDLDLRKTSVSSLSAGLKVGGSLILSDTSVASLPADLQVGDGLYLTGTPITSLPAGLKVGGDLNLTVTPVTALPADLKVGGNLFLYDTPIASISAGLQVDGDLNLTAAPVTVLPAGLKVGGDLNLTRAPVASLPADLQVGGDLFLYKTSVDSLPADLKVGGVIYGFSNKYWNNVPEHLKDKIQ